MSRPPFTVAHRWTKVGQVAHVQIDRCACGMERRHVGSGYVFYRDGLKCKAGECGRAKAPDAERTDA